MENKRVKIKLDLGATLPTRAHETDAGLDLYSMEDKIIYPTVLLEPSLKLELELVEDLDDTERGDNGFGSTGV